MTTPDTDQPTEQIDGEVRDLITRSENATRIPHGLDQAISTPDELRQWQTEREQARDKAAQSISKRLAGPSIATIEHAIMGRLARMVDEGDWNPNVVEFGLVQAAMLETFFELIDGRME